MEKMDRQLLETDQRECYAEDGPVISCEGAGQDGSYIKRTGDLRQGRFEVLDRVVKDRFTGAIWSGDANPAQFPLTWHEAQKYVAAMRARRVNGYGDWRLPSRALLFSLISHQHVNPALAPGHPFENVFPGYYWTADGCRRLADQAWYLHLGGGRIHRGMKQGSYMVWPVCPSDAETADPARSGRQRFSVDDGCVRDARTGLTWFQDANPAGRRLTWQEALAAVAALNHRRAEGYNDWRLPNIRELESLVDLASHSPALGGDHPFVHIRDGYWSSTTSVYESRYAWVLYSEDGIVGVGYKPRAEFFAWPVRRTGPG